MSRSASAVVMPHLYRIPRATSAVLAALAAVPKRDTVSQSPPSARDSLSTHHLDSTPDTHVSCGVTDDPTPPAAQPIPPAPPKRRSHRTTKPAPAPPDQLGSQYTDTGAAGPGAVPAPGSEPGTDERPGAAQFNADPEARRDFSRYPPDDTTNHRSTPTKTLGEAIKEVSEAFHNVQHPKKRLYAAAMALLGTVGKACEAVGISRGAVYSRQWREDGELQDALVVAGQMYGQVLEAEIDRRSVEGVWKPTGWYQGEPGGYIKEYSDLLLIFRTKGVLGDKYRDRVESRGWLASIDVTRLSDEQLQRIRAGESPLSVLGTAAQVVRALPAGDAEPDK